DAPAKGHHHHHHTPVDFAPKAWRLSCSLSNAKSRRPQLHLGSENESKFRLAGSSDCIMDTRVPSPQNMVPLRIMTFGNWLLVTAFKAKVEKTNKNCFELNESSLFINHRQRFCLVVFGS